MKEGEKLKKKLNKLLQKTVFNELFIKDSLFLMGVFIIITTNFLINLLFGAYFLGLSLIAFSVFLDKSTKKEGDKK